MSDILKTQIAIFGVLDFKIGGVSQHLGVTGPTRSMLQYLLCFQDRLIRREQLMELFWSHTKVERRRSSLNSAIWRIKKGLAPFKTLKVDATADCLRLIGATGPDVEVDMLCLEAALRDVEAVELPPPEALAALLGALDLCGAVPLDGLDEDWALIERERLEALRMRALTAAMRALAVLKRYDEALEMGRRILVQEPYRECTFQEVLCLHELNGERARVMQLYDRFEAALRQDLGIEPMPETKALLDYLADRGRPGGGANGAPAAIAMEGASRPGVDTLLCSIEHFREAFRASA